MDYKKTEQKCNMSILSEDKTKVIAGETVKAFIKIKVPLYYNYHYKGFDLNLHESFKNPELWTVSEKVTGFATSSVKNKKGELTTDFHSQQVAIEAAKRNIDDYYCEDKRSVGEVIADCLSRILPSDENIFIKNVKRGLWKFS